MTAIIGIKKGNKIVLAADGCITDKTYKWTIDHEDYFKITSVDGSSDCLIGCAGTCNPIHIVRNIQNLLNGKNEVNYNFIVNVLIPKLYLKVKDAGFLKTGEVFNSIECSIILATKKHLFKINKYGVLTECNSVALIGSGEDQLAVKYTSIKDKNIPIEKKAAMCIEHAIRNAVSIEYPIVIRSNELNSETVILKNEAEYKTYIDSKS